MNRRNALKTAAIALIGVLTPWKKAQARKPRVMEKWLLSHFDKEQNLVDRYALVLPTIYDKRGRPWVGWEEIIRCRRFRKACEKGSNFHSLQHYAWWMQTEEMIKRAGSAKNLLNPTIYERV